MDIAFVVLLVTLVSGRFILLNALKNLPEEDKAKVLSKSVMQLSQISLLITLAMVLAFYLLMSKYSYDYKPISIIFFTAILLLRMVTFSLTRKNMMASEVPVEYIRKFFISWLITTAGIIAFVYLTVKPFFE